jgi:hypothetical protein
MRVDYLFEQGHKHSHEADARLKAAVALPGIAKQFHYRSHAFLAKGEPGLQTADLFAYAMTKVQAHSAGKKIYPTLIPPLLKLTKAPKLQKLHVVTGEKLQRLLHEHDTSPHDLFVDMKHTGTLT